MDITKEKMVSVIYELKYDDADAELIEKVEKDNPLTFLFGAGQMLEHFEKNFLPKAREFKPDLVFISAGFDAHRDDPLAGMNLTEEVYVRMTKALKELARETAEERIVSVLEGGYNLEALSRSIELHLRALNE